MQKLNTKDMKKILCLIDVQNDFITGALRNEDAINAVPNIVEKVKNFDGDYIFLTQDTHRENYLETKEGQKLPVVHCVEGTNGWAIEESVAKMVLQKQEGGDMVVETIVKPTFGSLELASEISKIQGELEIEICGFCTDICVVSNALLLKAQLYDRANIKIIENCCAGVTPQTHFAACKAMEMCQIDIVNE